MATYKDDLDIIKAAEKDSSKLSLNAITELDNKGLLGMYGGGGSESDPGFPWVAVLRISSYTDHDTETSDTEYTLLDPLYSDFDLALKRDGQIVSAKEQPALLAIITDQDNVTQFIEFSGAIEDDPESGYSGPHLTAEIPGIDMFLEWTKVDGEEIFTLK